MLKLSKCGRLMPLLYGGKYANLQHISHQNPFQSCHSWDMNDDKRGKNGEACIMRALLFCCYALRRGMNRAEVFSHPWRPMACWLLEDERVLMDAVCSSFPTDSCGDLSSSDACIWGGAPHASLKYNRARTINLLSLWEGKVKRGNLTQATSFLAKGSPNKRKVLIYPDPIKWCIHSRFKKFHVYI